MPGVPGPAFVGPGIGVEVVDLAPGQRRREEGHPGRDVHDAMHPVRVQGRRQERRPRAAADPDQNRPVDAGRVHDRDGVGHELGVGVGGGRLRSIRPAVAARVDGDDPRRPGQVRHLRLPGPGVDQRIGRGEHEGGLTRAEHLVGDLDAVPLDEALCVRISRPHSPSSPVFSLSNEPRCSGVATPLQRSGAVWAVMAYRTPRGVFIMAIDNDKLNEFLGKFVGDLGATMAAGSVVIGHNLGLYKALANAPATAEELAEATQTAARYVSEWLRGQAASGYVQYDPADQTYSMTEEQAFVLTNPDGAVYAPGALGLALGTLKAVPRMTEAFRTGAGMGWHEQDADVFIGCEQFFRPGYIANLIPSWIPALGDRVRPGRHLRLPARHGRPAGRGPARPRGAQARRHLAHRRARRRRRRGRQ